MMSISPSNDMMKFSDVEYKDGIAVVTFEIPQAIFPEFNNFLSSLLGVFKYSQIKAKHKHAEKKVESEKFHQVRERQYENFVKSVLSKYDAAVASGLSVRESINKVKSVILKTGVYVTCYQIELVCRSNGRFRKRKSNGT